MVFVLKLHRARSILYYQNIRPTFSGKECHHYIIHIDYYSIVKTSENGCRITLIYVFHKADNPSVYSDSGELSCCVISYQCSPFYLTYSMIYIM